jgi:hypothetical protein
MTPIVPAFKNDYEQNMTSGDESDDEDLTDADSTQSDWSDGEYHEFVAFSSSDNVSGTPRRRRKCYPTPLCAIFLFHKTLYGSFSRNTVFVGSVTFHSCSSKAFFCVSLTRLTEHLLSGHQIFQSLDNISNRTFLSRPKVT